MAGSHLISHKDHITDLAVVLDTSSTTIEGMMEPNLMHKLFFMQKRTEQHRKESTYEINWLLGSTSPHQKRCCEQTFKNNDAFVHSPSLAFP